MQFPGYGWCWQPAVGIGNPAWRPYCDSGHWVYTDQGWFWESGYPWGDVVFHYGRWARQPGYGWMWVPGYAWAPSWVAWRHADREACIGWAPLPPAAQFVAGIGLTWRGRLVVDADFGLGSADFCFVGCDRFWERDYRGWILRRERADYVWRRSEMRNGYRREGGRLVVDGLGPQRVGLLTRRQVRPSSVRELWGRDQHEHFVARRQDVRRDFEMRRQTVPRENVRRDAPRPGQMARPDARGGDIPRGQAVQQRNENARVNPPRGNGPRAEAPRQAPGGAGPPRPRYQPTRPPVRNPAPARPAPRQGPTKDDDDRNGSRTRQ